MAYTRLSHVGAAVPTSLTATIASGATTATIADATGWSTLGATGPFYITIYELTGSDPDTRINEEKIQVTSISGTGLSGMTRGVDGTTAVSHVSGSIVEHVFTALEADEANAVAAGTLGKVVAKGDLLTGSASQTLVKTTVGTDNYVLLADSTAPGGVAWGTPNAAIADGSITTAKIANSGITTAKIADANVTTAKLVDANVTTAKIADGAVTGAKTSHSIVDVITTIPTGTTSGTSPLTLATINLPSGATTPYWVELALTWSAYNSVDLDIFQLDTYIDAVAVGGVVIRHVGGTNIRQNYSIGTATPVHVTTGGVVATFKVRRTTGTGTLTTEGGATSVATARLYYGTITG